MLLNLPPELIISITLYLNTSEKLQLVLTCKKLKDAILEQCLYETLDMTLNKLKTESIVLYFQKNRSKGQKVKVLRIDLDFLTDQLYSAIPLIFPNVVNFRDSYQQKYRPDRASSDFLKWKDTITCLGYDAEKKGGIMYELLEKNVFSRLTSLEVKPSKKRGGGHVDLLECIKNAHALERLSISFFNLTLNDMETIHSACPRLTTFKMSGCNIIVTESESLPNEIKPALHLSRVLLLAPGIYDPQCLFLAYLTQKYTKLIGLDLLMYSFISLRQKNQYLNRLNYKPGFIARKEDCTVTQKSYCKSASKMLSTFPSTLRMLTFEMPGVQDLMAVFSKKCVNITRLRCFNFVLSSPKDIIMFKNLPSLKYVHIALDPSLQKYKQIPASTSVTQLKLVISPASSHNYDMNIGWVLSMFPSLTDLSIENLVKQPTKPEARLVGSDKNTLTQYHNLRRLSLGFDATHSSLLNFIRATAPKLRELCCVIPLMYFEKQIESFRKNQAIATNVNEPRMKNEILHFAIDLTGFSLSCFYLKARILVIMESTKKDILLQLKKKGETSKDFIIPDDDGDDYRQVYSTKYSTEDVRKNVRAKVKVQYDDIKTIVLNSEVSIDLESQQIQQKRRYR